MPIFNNFEEEHDENEDEKKSTPWKRYFSAEKNTPGETLNII